MVKVKVCGLTRVADAVLAVELGATAIGLVFWDRSPRAVDGTQAMEIVGALPGGVTPVGVFVNAEPAWVCDIAGRLGLGAVQLHGEESAEYCEAMPVPVLKAVPLSGLDDVERALALPEHVTPLIDVCDPKRRGGTGVTVDWDLAARVAQQRRTFLAGGLHADNVAHAIEIVQPYGVDVSSGVEVSPGLKDPARLREFFAALESAGSERQVG